MRRNFDFVTYCNCSGTWIAACLDTDMVNQGASRDEAVKRLERSIYIHIWWEKQYHAKTWSSLEGKPSMEEYAKRAHRAPFMVEGAVGNPKLAYRGTLRIDTNLIEEKINTKVLRG